MPRISANFSAVCRTKSGSLRLCLQGFRNQIWAIGLDQDAVEGSHERYIGEIIALFCEWTGEREHETREGQTFFSLSDIAGETMENTA